MGDVCRINEVLRSVLKSQIINMQPAPVAIIGKFGWSAKLSERSKFNYDYVDFYSYYMIFS